MEKFSFGQQVLVVVNGEQVRGTISKINKAEDGEYLYEVSSSEASAKSHGSFREDEISIG